MRKSPSRCDFGKGGDGGGIHPDSMDNTHPADGERHGGSLTAHHPALGTARGTPLYQALSPQTGEGGRQRKAPVRVTALAEAGGEGKSMDEAKAYLIEKSLKKIESEIARIRELIAPDVANFDTWKGVPLEVLSARHMERSENNPYRVES